MPRSVATGWIWYLLAAEATTTVWPRRRWALTNSRASGRMVPAIFWTNSRSPSSTMVSSLWPRIAAYP